jgi:hypothetical protein
LALALALWLLLAPVLGNWTTPTVGVSFVLAVSTQALAVLAATLAASEARHGSWRRHWRRSCSGSRSTSW